MSVPLEVQRVKAYSGSRCARERKVLPPLEILVAEDPRGVIDCPTTQLAPGESMTCILLSFAEGGQHEFSATAEGKAAGGAAR